MALIAACLNVRDYQATSANTMGHPNVGSVAKNVAGWSRAGKSVFRKDAASVTWAIDGSATADARRNPGIAIQACPDVRETLDYATLESINLPASSQSIGFGVATGFLPRVRSATSRLQDGELARFLGNHVKVYPTHIGFRFSVGAIFNREYPFCCKIAADRA